MHVELAYFWNAYLSYQKHLWLSFIVYFRDRADWILQAAKKTSFIGLQHKSLSA